MYSLGAFFCSLFQILSRINKLKENDNTVIS